MTGVNTGKSLSLTARGAVSSCVLSLTLVIAVSGCGSDATPLGGGSQSQSGFPTVATKNTTRIGASDSASLAASASLAVWPGAGQRPASVALIRNDWRDALAAAPLTAPPFRSALLIADGDIPKQTQDAITRLNPSGVPTAGNVKRIVIGGAEDPGSSKPINADGPAALADAIDRSRISSGAAITDSVVVVGTDGADWAAPAAAWSARSGDPVLFAERDGLPKQTVAAIQRRGRPLIMLLAPTSVVSQSVEQELSKHGAVARITGANPTESSIAFAKFRDGDRGWGIVDSGHGLEFGVSGKALDSIVTAPISSAGNWPPLLMLGEGGRVSDKLRSFLLDIQPGYRGDPTRFAYNRAWLVGDTKAIPDSTQAELDQLLEIQPANETPKQ